MPTSQPTLAGAPLAGRLLALILAVGSLGLVAGSVEEAAAAATPAPAVTISPLPGTPDATPSTQISFLGAPASELHDITVVGTRSGSHSGRLAGYATAAGASFLPSRGFDEGERVTVTAVVGSGASGRRIASSFTIARLYALPSEPPAKHPVDSPADVQSFYSRHDLSPPVVDVTVPATNPSAGDIFLTSATGPGQDGPMILEPNGALVWFKPVPTGVNTTDLRVQQYEGKPVLTWWEGQIIDGHGRGDDYIYNSTYEPVATVHAGNGLQADLHEFDLTAQGTALISAYEPIHWNLSSIRSSHAPSDGLLDDCVVQEIDVRTGLVMFEWHALGHVPLSDSYAPVPHLSGSVYDYFHLNSIQPQADGDLLIGSRNTWAAYMISTSGGGTVWTLGGKHSSFTLGPGVRFAWEHDAEILPEGNVTIFDDESSPPESNQSRAIVIALDQATHTATLARQLIHPGTRILAQSQGNAEALPEDEEFVGWGEVGYASEFSAAGALDFDMHLPPGGSSYRAYRMPWSATPAHVPDLAASAGAGATTVVYASWNGATAVTGWRVFAGRSPRALTAVGQFSRAGFETEMTVPGTLHYLAVQALGPAGQVLGSSRAVLR
ncbi:MAG TPA: arylsulfotransferase family protein [Solirubrobacteraceae bacterium]